MKDITKIKLLETTLRDGSYTINYQFNAAETTYIAKILDEIGFEYIEIGPGIGFNAKGYSEHPPASSDEDYIIAARAVVKNAKIGMFFIPGIGRSEDIEMAAKNGLDLIRIGTNINEFEKGFKYIELCKRNSIETASNLMKSYAVSPIEFALIANECFKAGADTVYLVDSAGGMLPEDIKSFISEAKNKNPQISLGFHGHDNLGLAISNTLMAISCGADVVDSSIRGMGRSSGNTVTEKLIFVLKRMGFDMPYDISKLLELSDNVILEYLSGKPEKTLDMIYGFSQFHSSFIGVIKKYSEIYNIDPKELIIEYTKIDKFNIDEDITNKLAETISKKEKQVYHFKIENKVVKKANPDEQLDVLLHELYEQKHKFNKKAFFNISKTYENTIGKISPVIHSYENISFASAEVKDSSEVKIIFDKFKDSIDGFLIDERIGNIKLEFFNKDFYYNDSQLFAKSIFNHIYSIIRDKNLAIRKIFIDERDEISKMFIKMYSEKFILVSDIKDADLAVVGRNYYSQELFKSALSLKWVIINKPGIIESDVSRKIDNINFIRIDLSREVFTEIIERMNYSVLINKEYGVRQVENEIYCSGGYVGAKGSVVVDNINNVRQKFGISNGDGSVNYF